MSTLNVQNINGVGDLSLDTLTSNTLTSNSIILDGTTLTATSGSSNTIVTGTAGTNGQFAQWNSNGNVIGADINTLSQATWETGTDTTESLVSPAKVKAAIDSLAVGSAPILRVYSSSTTWTKPAGLVGVKVEVWGGGGGATNSSSGTNSPGGTSSFGSLVVATGGSVINGGTGTAGQFRLTGGRSGSSDSGGDGAGGGGSGGLYNESFFSAQRAGQVPGGGASGFRYGGENPISGGGGGGYACSFIAASSLGSSVSVTVGAAGGATYGAAGRVIVTEYY